MGFFSHMRDAKSGLAEVSTFACRILTENNKTTQWRTLSQSMKKKKNQLKHLQVPGVTIPKNSNWML